MSSRKSKWGWRWVDTLSSGQNTLFLLCHSFYFHCGPGPVTSSHSALGIHIPPSSTNWVAHHPPPTAKQGRNLQVPATLSQAHSRSVWEGSWQLLPAASKWSRKERKARKGCPQRGFSAFTEHRTPGRDWIIIQVMFSSLLSWQGPAALGWALLITAARFIIS